MTIILDDSEYSYDASTKVITLVSPYDGLSIGQILKIHDITTGSVFYDAESQIHPISLSGADITHTYDDANDTDADKLQITLDIGTVPTGDSTSNAPYANAIILNPNWAHISKEQPFNAQAADGSSTGYDVSSYKSLGFKFTDAICDGVLTIEDEDGTPIQFMLDGVLMWSYTCLASGTNKHNCQIVNCNPDQTIYVLTGRTTGSISIKTLYQY